MSLWEAIWMGWVGRRVWYGRKVSHLICHSDKASLSRLISLFLASTADKFLHDRKQHSNQANTDETNRTWSQPGGGGGVHGWVELTEGNIFVESWTGGEEEEEKVKEAYIQRGNKVTPYNKNWEKVVPFQDWSIEVNPGELSNCAVQISSETLLPAPPRTAIRTSTYTMRGWMDCKLQWVCERVCFKGVCALGVSLLQGCVCVMRVSMTPVT